MVRAMPSRLCKTGGGGGEFAVHVVRCEELPFRDTTLGRETTGLGAGRLLGYAACRGVDVDFRLLDEETVGSRWKLPDVCLRSSRISRRSLASCTKQTDTVCFAVILCKVESHSSTKLWNVGVVIPAFHFDFLSEKGCEREDTVYVGVLLQLDNHQSTSLRNTLHSVNILQLNAQHENFIRDSLLGVKLQDISEQDLPNLALPQAESVMFGYSFVKRRSRSTVIPYRGELQLQ